MAGLTLDVIRKPFFHFVVFILISIALLVALHPHAADATWFLLGIIYGIFIIFNSIAMIWPGRSWNYFFYSLGLSVLYILISFTIGRLYLSFVDPEGSFESSMIFLVILYHPFCLLIVIFLKWLYGILRSNS